jgi:hypothetical protein
MCRTHRPIRMPSMSRLVSAPFAGTLPPLNTWAVHADQRISRLHPAQSDGVGGGWHPSLTRRTPCTVRRAVPAPCLPPSPKCPALLVDRSIPSSGPYPLAPLNRYPPHLYVHVPSGLRSPGQGMEAGARWIADTAPSAGRVLSALRVPPRLCTFFFVSSSLHLVPDRSTAHPAHTVSWRRLAPIAHRSIPSSGPYSLAFLNRYPPHLRMQRIFSRRISISVVHPSPLASLQWSAVSPAQCPARAPSKLCMCAFVTRRSHPSST